MNSYKLSANGYREALEHGRSAMPTEVVADLEQKIRVFDFLAEFEPDDKYVAFDSGMFNEIFKGYIRKIIDELCDDDDEDIQQAAQLILGRVYGKSESILDRMNAYEAEAYYKQF